jgi:hypothetical protein
MDELRRCMQVAVSDRFIEEVDTVYPRFIE